MSLIPNFTAVQVAGLPSQILFTDTSTDSDAAIVSREVFLETDSGSFLVPQGTTSDFVLWALANATITIDALDKDYALALTVNWLDEEGNVLYTKTILSGETLYKETFDYYLTQMMTANKNLIDDNDFFPNKSLLRTYIDSGNQSIELASDQTNAQLCYDEATKLRLSSQYYYNANA